MVPDLDQSLASVARHHLSSGNTSNVVSVSGDYYDSTGKVIKRYSHTSSVLDWIITLYVRRCKGVELLFCLLLCLSVCLQKSQHTARTGLIKVL